MKKALIFPSLLLLLSLALPLTVGAVLTPAMEHLTEGATVIRTAAPGESIRFTDEDMQKALGVVSYPALTIVSLPAPTVGVLRLSGARVAAGQTVSRTMVPMLTFTPATPFVTEASFTFRAGSLSGGAELTCLMRFDAAENHAPTLSEADTPVFWQTRRNVSVFGTLAGYDRDGDELEYLIMTYPAHGTLFVTGASTGDFRYTPKAGYTGTDAFTYVIRDARGAYSAPATVHIQVDKKTMDLDFDGLDDTAGGFAAVMVAAGIMDADTTPSGLDFRAEEGMTRAGFLVAAMKTLGYAPDAAGAHTLFDDDGDIPVVLRGYFVAAERAGYLVGELGDSRLLCRPNDTITVGEAYRLLARMTGAASTCTSAEAYNALAARIPLRRTDDTGAALTRIRAAELLLRVSKTVN